MFKKLEHLINTLIVTHNYYTYDESILAMNRKTKLI